MDPLQQQALPPPPPPAPPVPTNVQQAQPPQPTSILERLREQVARELMPDETAEMQRRARTFGAALMGTRGNFFEGLAAGQQALEQQRGQDQQARAGRLQQLEQQAQREAELNLRQAEFEYNRDPANPTNQLRLAQARQALAELARGPRPTFIEGTDPTTGNLTVFDPVSGRRIDTGMRPRQAATLESRTEEAIRRAASGRAAQRLTTELRSSPTLPSAEAQRLRRLELEREELAPYGLEPRTSEGSLPVTPPPAAVLDLRRNPGGRPPGSTSPQ